MKIEELSKESKIIGFQDDINYIAIFVNSRLLKSNKKCRLIYVAIVFINRTIKFCQLLKRLKNI